MTTVAQPTVYGLHCVCGCDQRGIRYIGQTVQPLTTRLTNHRSHARFGTKTPVYHWIRKHGPENIQIVALEDTTLEGLDAREVDWIRRTPGLLNLAAGGEGGAFRGRKRPEHSEKVRGENHYASKLTEADVRSMRARHTGSYGELTRFAREYGVRVQTVEDAVKGRSWRHLVD